MLKKSLAYNTCVKSLAGVDPQKPGPPTPGVDPPKPAVDPPKHVVDQPNPGVDPPNPGC